MGSRARAELLDRPLQAAANFGVLDFSLPILENLRRRLFWIVARTCFTLYRWFPLFGTLRGSLAVIQRNQQFLLIQRNDGRGISLPGGLAFRKEAAEETLRREVLEETGLRITGLELRMHYHSTADVPCDLSVFEVQVTGELKNSWEGSPQWMTVAEIEPRIVESQRPVLELFRQLSAASPHEGTPAQ
jgi:8-oxo-dGTP pyrophosphatase MutT (NUDIX family)